MNNKPLEKKYFSNSTHHILAELERIDMLIRNYVTRSRQLQKVDSQFQGLYISAGKYKSFILHVGRVFEV